MMQRTALRCVIIVSAAELLLHMAWPHLDDNDPVPSIELQLGLVAAVVAFLLPHFLAGVASRERPTLLLPAGLLGALVTFFSSISPFLLLATVPLVLLPSIVYLVGWGIGAGRPLPRNPFLPVLLVLGGIGALLVLLATQDARCQGDSCTSDVIAWHESIVSLGLAAFVLRAGWNFGPQRGAPPPGCEACGSSSRGSAHGSLVLGPAIRSPLQTGGQA